ncbi:MAG: S-methyl-5-thioribose-1-phosphate isomerase [Candidatus Dormibacteria bacterium]
MKDAPEELHPISWTGNAIRLIDQTVLPRELRYLEITDVQSLIEAIQRLRVRGAPALGAAGALGVVLALHQQGREGWDEEQLSGALERIRRARPTARNLAWGVDAVQPYIALGESRVLSAALALVAADEAGNHEIGRRGADWIMSHVSGRPIRVLTHCNTGALATTGWGTALGIVRELHMRDVLAAVFVDETRPLLQGARLTAFELRREGITHFVQVDGAAASTILSGRVDVAIIGADRIAANGDTANKIGSLGLALACREGGIPFVVAAPESTIDGDTASGDDIAIELRSESEVLSLRDVAIAPDGSRAHNPAFDITPARFVSVLVTEARVLEVAGGEAPVGSRPAVAP